MAALQRMARMVFANQQALSFALPGQQGVHRYAIQPGVDSGAALEVRQRAMNGNQGLLIGVGGVIDIAEHPTSQSFQPLAIESLDLCQRLVALALLDCGQQTKLVGWGFVFTDRGRSLCTDRRGHHRPP